MAGRGPAPQGFRSRDRDEPEHRTVRADSAVRGFPLPDAAEILPPINNKPQTEWHPITVQWWESWRSSPQAQEMLTEPDWMYLLDTAVIHHRYWKTGNFEQAAELRIRAAKFGATPEDRARLKMDVTTPGDRFPMGSDDDPVRGNVASFEEERLKRLVGGS